MPDNPLFPEEVRTALQDAVADLEARGRVTRVAGVKSQVQRHLPDFDERRLGYPSFGAFVEAAARAGVVRAERDSDGWMRVVSIDAPRVSEEPVEGLRPDIWRAFTTWGGGRVRVWDRATARAVHMSAEPSSSEPAEHMELREALARDDGQVIRIDPVDMQEQLEWMRQFADTLGDHPLAAPLKASLTDSKPFRAFSLVLRADDAVRRAFNRSRTIHILAAVRKWAAEHAVDLDAVDHRAPEPTPTQATHESSTDVATDLRLALHRAIDEMPVEDLRRLSVPAGYIVDALR